MHFVFVLGAVTQSCLTLCNPVDCSPPDSSVHGNSPSKNTGVGCHALQPGIKPRSPTLQVDSLLSEPPGKPKNTGVGSLNLLKGNLLARNRTGVSGIASGFFTPGVTGEAWLLLLLPSPRLTAVGKPSLPALLP